jgi:hypothetical protein
MAKKSKKIKPAAKGKKDEGYNKCMRCDKRFPSRDALKKHQKMHQQAMYEVKMLEEGFVPIESKIGFEFKGKNRIIVS